MQEISKKNGTIDIYRLLFALVIMAGHSVTIGMKPPFPFAGVGIFVEFFYLLTGYFTLLHFDRQLPRISSEWIAESLRYTWKKFKAFFPYVSVSVSLIYLNSMIRILQDRGVSLGRSKA